MVGKYFFSLSFFVTLRRPGIEPGPRAWKARILTIELSAHAACVVREKERERESERKKIFFLVTLRYPGIEPGPHRWQRRILTTELIALTKLNDSDHTHS